MPLTLPDYIFDSHQRYTQRNGVVINWLLEKAGPDIEPGPTIKVARLIPLAHQLVKRTGSPLEVPTKILDALRMTISLRQECTAWYKQQTVVHASLHDSNRRHEHFTNVLEGVRRVLEAHRTSARIPLETSRAVERPINTRSAAVNTLWSEHTANKTSPGRSEVDKDIATDTPSTLPEAPFAQTQQPNSEEPTAAEEDPYMAIFLMLEENLDPLRQFVLEKWQEYQDGKIHLTIVATITNIAIGFARRIESDFLNAFSGFSTWEDVVAWMLPSEGQLQGKPGTTSNHLLDLTFFPLFQQLCEFLRDRGIQRRRPFSPQLWSQENDSDESKQDDGSQLSELLLGALLLEVHKETLPTQDELVHGLKGIFAGDKISLWVVFGLQLVLDSTHVLSPAIPPGFRQLTATTKVFTANMNDHAVFLRAINGGDLSRKRIKKLFSNVHLIDRWVTSDKFMELQEHDDRIEPKLGPFSFFAHNPLASGVLQLGILLNMQRGGIENVNAYRQVLAMAHLYNVLKCEERLDTPWQDMETFLALHGHDFLIDHKPRGSLQAHLACLQMALEKSIASVPLNKRHLITPSFRHQSHPGTIQKSKIVGAFEGLLCPSETSAATVTIAEIEAILSQDAHRKENDDDSVIGQWNQTHTLPPLDLLQSLSHRLSSEVLKVLTNYQRLHHTCWTLLSDIEQDMHGEFEHWLASQPKYTKSKNVSLNLHWLPYYLLLEAILPRQLSPYIAPGEEGKGNTGRRDMLTRAERVLGRFLMEEGGDGRGRADGVAELGPAVLWGILEG